MVALEVELGDGPIVVALGAAVALGGGVRSVALVVELGDGPTIVALGTTVEFGGGAKLVELGDGPIIVALGTTVAFGGGSVELGDGTVVALGANVESVEFVSL